MDDTPVLHLANRLHSAAIHLLRWARTVDRETGLSPERLSILSVLTFAGPKTVTELAEAELVSPPAISRILNGLEADGHVARERSSEDRRVVHVRVTRAGKRIIDEARSRRLERIATRLGRLDERQLRVLRSATELLESLE
jgi:DNA-binding MarR family transcriptional regulator